MSPSLSSIIRSVRVGRQLKNWKEKNTERGVGPGPRVTTRIAAN